MLLINLLPWRQIHSEQTKKRWLCSAIALSGGLLIVTISLRIYLNQRINLANLQLQQLQTLSKTQEQQQLVKHEQTKQQQRLNQQHHELQTLNARRYVLLQALTLFADHLPNKLYLTALQQHDGVWHISGQAMNHDAINQLLMELTHTPEFKLAQLQFIKTIPNSEKLAFTIDAPENLSQPEQVHDLAME